ncbi:Chromate resistance protein ChrB [Fundicoccus culcitae]|uniref:ChrB N-terminal domain-containing protein n=1 Tax=Fundicoccus culcitae TaxID=2969821 RepID=A0ABY5P816_9LACT|nr:Chromate resistance protein ChrB [Fundicoccus culcitae]UUX34804.1 hypothetical protein NRE15_03905 [Fundicoccus culcitae]
MENQVDYEWLMLNFTIPKEPSRVRVSVWRKLKKQGAVSIGQSTWLLPAMDNHLDFFNDIVNEIQDNHGTAYLAKADFITTTSSDDIVDIFNQARNEEYKEFLEKCEDFYAEIENETNKDNFTYVELEENEDEYNKLLEWFKKISFRDSFTAPLKTDAIQAIEKCQNLLETFTNRVYELNN